MLNNQQLAAVTADDARLQVLAAPGSGKTRVLIERLARLLSSGTAPDEILALTFTRKASVEMRERLEFRLPEKRPSFWRDLQVSTFHAWCAATLRTYADRLGMVPNFSIYDDVDHDDLVRYAARELGKCPAPGAVKKPGQWTQIRRLWQEEDIRKRYYGLLREANAVDYDGLERLVLKLLEQEDVAAELRRRRVHVLVDEGQDTSREQQAILDALDPANLFVVGDFSQSIYGFRGANVAGFVDLGKRPGWRTIQLPTNYRSLGPIVEGATRLGEAMVVKGLQQESARGGGHEQWTLAQLAGADRDELAARIVYDIQKRHTDGEDGAEAPFAWHQMAVLSPTWDMLDELSPHLEAAGIPHFVARRPGQVWDSEAARWLVVCLRVALNPHDHASLWSALNMFTPRMTLGAWAGVRSRAMRAGGSVLDAVTGEVEAPVIADSIREVCAAVSPDATGWPEAGDALIERLRAELVLLHLDTKREELDAAEKALCAWGDARTEAGETFTVRDFLDWHSGRHVIEQAAEAEQADRVILTTVHGAKGLEWRGVWVLGCEEGKLPRAFKPDADGASESLEEQRRSFYVAITRGMDRVRMCWSRHRERSRFVGEALGAAEVVDVEPEPEPMDTPDGLPIF